MPQVDSPFWPRQLDPYPLLDRMQWMDKEALENLQLSKLRHMLFHAAKNVPYYRELFSKIGFNPHDLTSLADLQQLPLLNKETVQARYKDFVAENLEEDEIIWGATSGTTGLPLKVAVEARSMVVRNAVSRRFWLGVLGRDPRELRTVRLRNGGVPADSWFTMINDSLRLAPCKMVHENLPQYLDKIREYKPDRIVALPSVLTILATYALRKDPLFGKKVDVKAIGCTGETLYPDQREAIERAFDAPVYDSYGIVEQVAIFHQCEKKMPITRRWNTVSLSS